MAVFATNQNRHLYVSSAYNASVTDASSDGTIGAVKVVDGVMYFKYKGDDNTLKSDYINLKNLDYSKIISADDLVTPLTSYKVTLASAINSGNPVTGQDYVLRIVFHQWVGMSELDQYVKDAAVHVTAAMTADKKEFYKAMVAALNQAFSRELGATPSSNPYLSFSAGTSGSEDGIYIMEKPQDYNIGTEAQERVIFDVQPTTIYTGGEDVIWGSVANTTVAKGSAVVGTNAIGNGAQIADLEYFCMGERGDQYRNVGWPYVIPTKYMANPTLQYHVVEFHHAFTGAGENSYRSEKDITVVFPTSAKSDAIAFVKAVQNAASITVAKSEDAATWTWT